MSHQIDRRSLLSGLLAGAAATATGCGSQEGADSGAPTSVLSVRVDEIPADGRVVRELLDVPVEFRRRGDTVEAMSLLCSHQMCRLEWQEDDRRYFCPCHDGLFDEAGAVVYGPPRRPLRRLTITRDADTVSVDVHEVYRARTD